MHAITRKIAGRVMLAAKGGKGRYREGDVEGVVGVVQLFEEPVYVQLDVHIIVACKHA
jgi:hypothetical protein